jgi:hypothetical protein
MILSGCDLTDIVGGFSELNHLYSWEGVMLKG